MSDAPDLIPDAAEKALRRRIGPAPLGVWMVGAAVVLGAGAYLLRRRRGGAVAEAVAEPSDTTTPATARTIPTSFAATGSSTGTSSATGSTAWPDFAPASVDTNFDWRRRAVTWLTASGSFAGTLIATAVDKYLSGSALTAQERAVVDLALANVGPTPEPVPPPIDADPGTGTGGGGGGEPPPSTVGGGSTPPAPAVGTLRFNGTVDNPVTAGRKYIQQYAGSGNWRTLFQQVNGNTYRVWGPIAGGLDPAELSAFIAAANQALRPLGVTIVP